MNDSSHPLSIAQITGGIQQAHCPEVSPYSSIGQVPEDCQGEFISFNPITNPRGRMVDAPVHLANEEIKRLAPGHMSLEVAENWNPGLLTPG